MDLGAVYQVTEAHQFWSELDEILNNAFGTDQTRLEAIDFALESYLLVSAQFYDQFLLDEASLEHWFYALHHSRLFKEFRDRSTENIVKFLLTQSDPSVLYLCLLIIQKRAQKHVFRSLRHARPVKLQRPDPSSSKEMSVMLVMMEIVRKYGKDSLGHAVEETKLAAHERLGLAATQMLYDICRVSKLNKQELEHFSKDFIEHLFNLVEQTRDKEETFNFTLVKLICALNEQFMVASLDNASDTSSVATHTSQSQSSHRHGKSPKPSGASSESNIVLVTIKEHLGSNKTFGENLIFLLNRCGGSSEDLCVSLLVLKILYLLFTTPSTQEYFYTNDLCVLVDVFIRELDDLPEENEGLRHTYLRVLHPLMTNTQLKFTPYKRVQVRRLLYSLISDSHRRTVNPTTKRLVERNLKAGWCAELESGSDATPASVASPVSPAMPPEIKTSLYKMDQVPGRNDSIDSVISVAKTSTSKGPRKHPRHQFSVSSTDDLALVPDSTHNLVPGQKASRLYTSTSNLDLPSTTLQDDGLLHPIASAAASIERPASASSTESTSSSSRTVGRRKPPEPPRHRKPAFLTMHKKTSPHGSLGSHDPHHSTHPPVPAKDEHAHSTIGERAVGLPADSDLGHASVDVLSQKVQKVVQMQAV